MCLLATYLSNRGFLALDLLYKQQALLVVRHLIRPAHASLHLVLTFLSGALDLNWSRAPDHKNLVPCFLLDHFLFIAFLAPPYDPLTRLPGNLDMFKA